MLAEELKSLRQKGEVDYSQVSVDELRFLEHIMCKTAGKSVKS